MARRGVHDTLFDGLLMTLEMNYGLLERLRSVYGHREVVVALYSGVLLVTTYRWTSIHPHPANLYTDAWKLSVYVFRHLSQWAGCLRLRGV